MTNPDDNRPPDELSEIAFLQGAGDAELNLTQRAGEVHIALVDLEYAALRFALAEDLVNLTQRARDRRATYAVDSRYLLAGAVAARLGHLIGPALGIALPPEDAFDAEQELLDLAGMPDGRPDPRA